MNAGRKVGVIGVIVGSLLAGKARRGTVVDERHRRWSGAALSAQGVAVNAADRSGRPLSRFHRRGCVLHPDEPQPLPGALHVDDPGDDRLEQSHRDAPLRT